MSIMNLARPGSKYGPCLGECNHVRCARSRATAGKVCRQCGQEIGYGVDCTEDPSNAKKLVHLACLQAAAA